MVACPRQVTASPSIESRKRWNLKAWGETPGYEPPFGSRAPEVRHLDTKDTGLRTSVMLPICLANNTTMPSHCDSSQTWPKQTTDCIRGLQMPLLRSSTTGLHFPL